jgi:hypothetical protein
VPPRSSWRAGNTRWRSTGTDGTDTEEMNRERAETYLRLLGEAELRHAKAPLANRASPHLNAPSLTLATNMLSAVGAVGIGTGREIRHDLDLAWALRQRGPLDQMGPGPGRLSAVLQWRRERFVRFFQPGNEVFPASGPSPGYHQHAPWPVAPVGQVLRIRDAQAHGELYVLAYAQTAVGIRFTMAGWIEESPGPQQPQPRPGLLPRRIRRQFTARDDQGTGYQLSFFGPGGAGRVEWHGLLELQPDPSHQLRWLDVTTIPGEPVTRIDLAPENPGNPEIPAPEITVTPRTASPGELLLDLIASRLLAAAAALPHQTPEELAADQPGLVPHADDELGDIVATLREAEALPPASPVPAQLARLCASLGIEGHRITAPPARDLPAPWQSMLSRYHRHESYRALADGSWVATAARLPELDGVRIAILGLHHGEYGTIVHLHASGVTPEDDWEYYRGVRPLPVLWVRDSSDRWHATRMNGYSQVGDTGEVMLYPAIVPPLDFGTAWVDVVAASQSAEVRVRLPLRWA